GFKQGAPDLPQRGLDIGFRQRAAPGQPVKNAIEAFRKTVEHFCLSASPHRAEGENEKAPEGASRCRAVASGLKGPMGGQVLFSYESERNLVRGPPTVNRVKRPPDRGKAVLVHEPEKWEPVFRKDHAQTTGKISRLNRARAARL